jgi:ribonucleoside-triphosphate reductase (formate)
MKRKVTLIKKRDGTIVELVPEKITNAISLAAASVSCFNKKEADQLSKEVVSVLNCLYDDKNIPSVENIQDVVENVLIKTGHIEIAKSYILYRKQHENIRASMGSFLEVKKSMNEYLEKTDWRVYENSNGDYSFSGLMSHVAGKIIANYTLDEIYSKQVSDAHKNGDMHIHDLGYGVVGYCSGWSLKNLLLIGFGGVSKKIRSRPPKHLDVVCIQIVNFLGTLQMEHAGAQAFSSVDTLLAPFVKIDKLCYDEVKQNIQMLVYSLNVPSRWSCQAPFTNFTFDWSVPLDMKDIPAIVGGKDAPFTYGECQKEMDMVNRAFIEVMLEGDADGRTFFYPIPTYNLTKQFNWESDNAQLLFEMTSKYGTPYFQNFINSSLNPADIRSMCCRLQLDLKILRKRMGGLFGAADQTGSIGVVTINAARLGYLSNSKIEFFRNLEKIMDIAKESLETKRKVVEKNMEMGLMPFTKKYLGNYNNHFSTIGINGMNEALLNLTEEGIATKNGKNIAKETLQIMRNRLQIYQEETGHLYNLEASPCESATYRFAKEDLKRFSHIITAGTKKRPYYTNSTHLPVNFTDDLFASLEHQNELQMLYTGGTVHHCLVGEKIEDWKLTRKLVRKIAENFHLPYFTITPTFSICPEHGYIAGEHFSCPHYTHQQDTGGESNELRQENRSVQPYRRLLQASAELE